MSAIALFLAVGLVPPAAHSTRVIDGWTVHIDRRLLAGPDAVIGTHALRLIDGQLLVLGATVAPDRLAILRRVPIWLDRSHGRLTSAQYHPSADWLANNGYDRRLAKAVHLPSVRHFVAPRTVHHQPCVLLHEIAHAYHDPVLGFGDPRLAAAHRDFVASGRHRQVLHADGRRTRHYAATNPQEFFAEMTESYLGRNDFFPFNGAELKESEPATYALMESIWGPRP